LQLGCIIAERALLEDISFATMAALYQGTTSEAAEKVAKQIPCGLKPTWNDGKATAYRHE
jgi:hypothetical protein